MKVEEYEEALNEYKVQIEYFRNERINCFYILDHYFSGS